MLQEPELRARASSHGDALKLLRLARELAVWFHKSFKSAACKGRTQLANLSQNSQHRTLAGWRHPYEGWSAKAEQHISGSSPSTTARRPHRRGCTSPPGR